MIYIIEHQVASLNFFPLPSIKTRRSDESATGCWIINSEFNSDLMCWHSGQFSERLIDSEAAGNQRKHQSNSLQDSIWNSLSMRGFHRICSNLFQWTALGPWLIILLLTGVLLINFRFDCLSWHCLKRFVSWGRICEPFFCCDFSFIVEQYPQGEIFV